MKAMAALLASAGLLASCGDSERRAAGSRDEPVRRAAYLSAIARDFLVSCPGSELRGEARRQRARHEELKQLAAGKRAVEAIWRGENEYAALAQVWERRMCQPGDAAYRSALADYSVSLDALAARIAEYRR